ncbi:hypothetical protein ACV566_06750 [Staphylococcus aureus]
MCHPLPLTGIGTVSFSWDETNAPLYTLNIPNNCLYNWRNQGSRNGSFNRCISNGFNHLDMTKAVDKGMIIGETYLESKSGGKSGDFQRQSNQ